MTIRLVINGYGRIGRSILRAYYQSSYRDKLEIVAINDLGDIAVNAHLTRYDSTHGAFPFEVVVKDNALIIQGDTLKSFQERDPSKLPWKDLDVDVVLECSGCFRRKAAASLHLKAGAKQVLISAPASDEVDATIVYGINHHRLSSDDYIVSNASCTTNCLAALLAPLIQTVGIESGLMTTIHAYTNDQVLTDSYHTDLRRSRSATQSLIPTKTGAASALGLIFPEMIGKLDGLAVRVPTLNVSLVDLTFEASQSVSVEAIHHYLKEASYHQLSGILSYNEEPLVSIDFNHNPASCIYDATQTRVSGKLVKLLAWYDNEWGFSHRMLDTAYAMALTQINT